MISNCVSHPAGGSGCTTEGGVTGTEVEGGVAGMDVVVAIIVSESGVSSGDNGLHANSKNAAIMENVKVRCIL